MNSRNEQIISWITNALSRTDEGITFSDLFENLQQYFKGGDEDKDFVWSKLVNDHNVVLQGSTEACLGYSPLSKLDIRDIFTLGLGQKKIFLKQLTVSDNSQRSDPRNQQIVGPSERSQFPHLVNRGDSFSPAKMTGQVAELSCSNLRQEISLNKSNSIAQPMPNPTFDTSFNSFKLVGPGEDIPRLPQTPKTGEEGNSRTSTSKKTDSSCKKVTYTPYEQMRFEAGVAGAYINPKIKGAPESTRGRPLKRPRLVVFKSDKLKDPKWLETKRGTWHEYVAEAIASQIIFVENNTQVPQKRKTERKKQATESTETSNKKPKLPENLSPEIESSQSCEGQAQKLKSHLQTNQEPSKTQMDLQSLPPKSLILNTETPATLIPLSLPKVILSSEKDSSTERQSDQPSNQTFSSTNLHQQPSSKLGEKEIAAGASCRRTSRESSPEIHENQSSAIYRQADDEKSSAVSTRDPELQHGPKYYSPYLNSEKEDQSVPLNQQVSSKISDQSHAQNNQNKVAHMYSHKGANSNVTASLPEDSSRKNLQNSNTLSPADEPKRLQTEAYAQSYNSPFPKNSSIIGSALGRVASEKASSSHSLSNSTVIGAKSNLPLPATIGPSDSSVSFTDQFRGELSITHPQNRSLPQPETLSPDDRNESNLQRDQNPTTPKTQKNLKRKNSQSDLQDEQSPTNNLAKRNKSCPKRRTRASGIVESGGGDLEKATSVQFPPDRDRLVCRYQGKAGNLLLSSNKQSLEFFTLDQKLSEAPLLSLEIPNITKNPITSMTGSTPMELRIKVIDQSNTVIDHAFEFAETLSASEAATNMRAKIVAGIVACKFRSGEDYHHPIEIKNEIQKPYICEKCSKRFKNQNGLEYHLTKAATTCNPNYDPEIGPGKRGRKRKLPHELKKRKSRQNNHASQNGNSQNDSLEKKENEEQSSSNDLNTSNSSDDSVIRWAFQNATSGIEGPRKDRDAESTPKSATGHRSFLSISSKESRLLNQIAKELPESSVQDQCLDKLDFSGYDNLIVSLVKVNNNVFPGNKSIWLACVCVWLKIQRKEKFSSVSLTAAPEFKSISQHLEDLIGNGKLVKHNIEFPDKTGKQIIQHIVSTPDIEPNSMWVKEIHDLMKDSYPNHYIPSPFCPAVSVLKRLTRIEETRDALSAAHKKIGLSFKNSELIGDQPGLDDLDSNSDSDYAKNSNHKNIVMPENNKGFSTGASDLSVSKRSSSRVVEKTLSRNLSRSLRTRPNTINSALKSRKDSQVTETLGPKKRPARLLKTPSSLLVWKHACFLQNPKTGSWELPMPSCSKTSTIRSTYRSRYLPEPITFLQAQNGTWSIRPFGHGVTPIYSRPSRMTTGNPNGVSYLEKKHNSFRPIMYPSANNVVHYPLPLSKHFKGDRPVPRTPPTRKTRTAEAKIQAANNTQTATQNSLKKVSTPVTNSHNEVAKKVAPKTPKTPKTPQTSQPLKRYNTRQKIEPRFSLDLDKDIESVHESTELTTSKSNQLNEIEMLSLFEPKKLGSEAARNPGLETLPPSFGISNSFYTLATQASIDYLANYSMVEFVEANSIADDSDLAVGSWIVSDMVQRKSDDYDFRWDDQTAFDLESIPYRDLTFALNIEETVPETRRSQFPKVKSTRCKPSTGPSRLRCTRILTHLNIDFCGIGDGPEASSKFLGIPMAAGDDIAKLRKRNSHDSMSAVAEKRFIVAVVIIRALTGGIECLTDWVLVSLLFPKFSLNFLRGHWKQLLIRHKDAIDQLESDFQGAFIAAYESGEIPAIDYDHLQDYDWNNLVNWTISNVDTSFSHKPVSIPSSRTELEQCYKLEVLESKESWRDKCFETNAATYRRLDYASFNALIVPIREPKKKPSDFETTDLTVVKSWIRAIALSPENECSLHAATERVKEFGEELAARALAELIDSKVIMQRTKKRPTSSTRSYEVSEFFSRPLRREIKPKCFRDANVFKQYLDSEFRNGKDCVRVDYMAWDGDVMVISNLLAHERIQLLAVGVPNEKFGLTDGGYETKKIPRERLRFEVDIHPNPTYIFEDQNEGVLSAQCMGPPRGNQQALPVWYSVNETVIAVVWKEVYSAVAQLLALRAGITFHELTRIFTSTMEGWEIKLLLDWGEQHGLFQRLHKDIDGWIAGEWWWAYAMTLFARDRFMAGQEVRYEPKDPFTMEGRHAG